MSVIFDIGTKQAILLVSSIIGEYLECFDQQLAM